MQKLLLVVGSVAVCQLLSGCGTSTATTSCKFDEGDKQIDCAGISTACCTAHHNVENISSKEVAISVKETSASEEKDHAKLGNLEKDVAAAVVARGKACTAAENAAAKKCYIKTIPAAEMVAEVPLQMAVASECPKDTGVFCGDEQALCDLDLKQWCNSETGNTCWCPAWECAVEKDEEDKTYWEKTAPSFMVDNEMKCQQPENGPAIKKESEDTAAALGGGTAAKADQELAQFNNQAFAGLAGFIAGGVVLVAVAKVRTSSMHTDENSYQNMEG